MSTSPRSDGDHAPVRRLIRWRGANGTMSGGSLLGRFSVLCIGALVLFAISFGWLVTWSLEKNMVSRAQEITAGFVAAAISQHFRPEDLETPKVGTDYDTVAATLRHPEGTGDAKPRHQRRARDG